MVSHLSIGFGNCAFCLFIIRLGLGNLLLSVGGQQVVDGDADVVDGGVGFAGGLLLELIDVQLGWAAVQGGKAAFCAEGDVVFDLANVRLFGTAGGAE